MRFRIAQTVPWQVWSTSLRHLRLDLATWRLTGAVGPPQACECTEAVGTAGRLVRLGVDEAVVMDVREPALICRTSWWCSATARSGMTEDTALGHHDWHIRRERVYLEDRRFQPFHPASVAGTLRESVSTT